uniref:Uncharacterized protein n=1 Tax=Eutreptiella gymnastica TaxID=73025 RepID=A0A7S4CY37_9EUGL
MGGVPVPESRMGCPIDHSTLQPMNWDGSDSLVAASEWKGGSSSGVVDWGAELPIRWFLHIVDCGVGTSPTAVQFRTVTAEYTVANLSVSGQVAESHGDGGRHVAFEAEVSSRRTYLTV